jgi:hypothetical protein
MQNSLAVVVAALVLAGCAATVDSSAPTEAPAPSTSHNNSASSPSQTAHHPRHKTTPPRRHHRRHAKPHIAGVPPADLPDRHLTPGAARTTSTATVCVSGSASLARNVPDSEKEQAYARYGVIHVPYQHEVDHLISLELGGSNAITNLWPEPYAGRWGARTRDILENHLHDLVCSGVLTLRHAQHVEATNWVAAYKKYVGTPPASRPRRRTHHPAPSAGGTCEPGYTPCLPIVSDLDCGQIDASKKPVHITGDNPYRLDADGDGLGCDT